VLLLCFALVTCWKLALLALETYEHSRFTRPPVQVRPAPATSPPPSGAGVDAILRETGLPGGVVGVYVKNLNSGVGARINAERRFHAASLYKLPVMVEVFKQLRLKRFSLDDELTIDPRHWTDGSGVLQARVGDRVRIGELLRLMIAESDNIAANMLVELVEANNVNQTMAALGLQSTRVVDPQRENAAPTTSPEDVGRLLELIATGRMVDADASEEAVRLLEIKQAQEWLADGLPPWGKLAHKWGDVPNWRHDAGIIYTPHNQIVLVVLTENGGPALAAEQIRTVSRRVVSYFEGPGP
jgi:beta-lactamase class A